MKPALLRIVLAIAAAFCLLPQNSDATSIGAITYVDHIRLACVGPITRRDDEHTLSAAALCLQAAAALQDLGRGKIDDRIAAIASWGRFADPKGRENCLKQNPGVEDACDRMYYELFDIAQPLSISTINLDEANGDDPSAFTVIVTEARSGDRDLRLSIRVEEPKNYGAPEKRFVDLGPSLVPVGTNPDSATRTALAHSLAQYFTPGAINTIRANAKNKRSSPLQ